MRAKPRVVRVVTASFIVPWHLTNTLKRMTADFEVCVAGQGVSVFRDRYPDVKWVDIDINRKIHPLADLKSLIALCQLFRSYKPDIVHSIVHKAALLSAIAGFICRVPVRINTFTSQLWATEKGLRGALYYLADCVINLLNTACLTDSPSQSAFLQQHKISRNGKPLPVLSRGSLSGVDLERFDPSVLKARTTGLRRQLGLRETDFVFAFVARKHPDKGPIETLRAFASVHRSHARARLLFVGPDESNGQIEALQRTHPEMFRDVVDVPHAVDNHEEYLAISDVLCLPSYREGFGSIVIDAAALGVPAIGFKIPGLVDSVEDGETGVLLPAGDIEALIRAMTDLIEDQGKRERMRLAARKRVERYFSADVLYRELRALYLDLLRSHSH